MKTEVVRVIKTGNDTVCGDTPIIRAYVDVQFEDVFVVKGFVVKDCKGDLHVDMPTNVSKDGKWYHYFLPLEHGFKTQLVESILKEYNKEV